jgi:hypothetical protein
MTSLALPADLELPVKVSKLVGLGFGITLVGGVISPLAITIGLRARRLIKSSPDPLSGIGLAWWCIVVGAINSVYYFFALLFLFMNMYFPATP